MTHPTMNLADLPETMSPIYVAFSGGMESVALVNALKPFHDRLTLLWVNTGAMFPHMVEFVRDYGRRLPLVELTSDLMANWKSQGLPARVLPVANAMPFGAHVEPKIQPWILCCKALRSEPIEKFLAAAAARPSYFVHGQRRKDFAAGHSIAPEMITLPEGVRSLAPLWGWERTDVAGYVEANGLTLPKHYPRIADSLECWACTGEHTRERSAYMRDEYPELLATVLPGLRRVHSATVAALQKLDDAIETAAGEEPPLIIVQRGGGDCVVATIATLIGRSYEAVATLLGFPNPERGGVAYPEIGGPLLSIGWAVTPLLAKEHPGSDQTLRLLDQPGIRETIQGRRAILTVQGDNELHAVAWTGSEALDCVSGDRFELDDVTVFAAQILSRVPITGAARIAA